MESKFQIDTEVRKSYKNLRDWEIEKDKRYLKKAGTAQKKYGIKNSEIWTSSSSMLLKLLIDWKHVSAIKN